MWIKREEYEKLEKRVKHYKELAGTHLVIINEKNAEIEKTTRKNKKIRSFKIAKRHF